MDRINTEGGPLILLDERSLASWGGVIQLTMAAPAEKSFSPDGRPTDYDHACCVDGYLARIPVGSAEALVLGDEPMPTSWVPTTTGGVLVRWYAENEGELVDWLRKIPETIFEPEFLFSVEGGRLLLFDSAVAGRNVKKRPGEYLSIELDPGIYRIETAVYEPDARTSMVVHRFELTR